MQLTHFWDWLGLGQRENHKEWCEGAGDELCWPALLFVQGWPEVLVLLNKVPNVSPLHTIQTLSRSLLAAEINAPTQQMNPEGVGASNHEK